MKTLDEIAIEHGTDKATVFTRNEAPAHHYTPIYDKLFTPVRESSIRFLEIGVGGGESIRTWLDYFPHAEVFGVDFVQDTNEWNTENARTHARYRFSHGNQADPAFWASFRARYGLNWDIIVDDGGHLTNEIITTFTELWPHVNPGGLYCVEDLRVTAEAKAWLTERAKDSDIEKSWFEGDLCIFKKK